LLYLYLYLYLYINIHFKEGDLGKKVKMGRMIMKLIIKK